MTETPSAWVVDASIVIKLFVPEADADKARGLLARLSTQPTHAFHVPDLLYVECANILWKGISRFNYSFDKVKKDLSDLRALGLTTDANIRPGTGCPRPGPCPRHHGL